MAKPMTNSVRASVMVIATSIGMLVCASATLGSTHVITDGNSLLRMCEAALVPLENLTGTTGAIDHSFLMGYISGFIAGQPREVPYEIPHGVTIEQVARVIKKWLQDHPNKLNQPAPDLIFLSLKDAFPADKTR